MNEITIVESLWNPHRLVSLWEMIELHCSSLCESIKRVTIIGATYAHKTVNDAEGSLELSPAQKSEILRAINNLGTSLHMLEVPNLLTHMVRRCDFIAGSSVLTAAVVYSELESMMFLVHDALDERKFVYIPRDKDKFFENDKVLGDYLPTAFPLFRQDVIDASNCMSLGIYNSAVNGWLRILELGLKRLALYCSIETESPRTPPPVNTEKQISHLDWGKIIKRINIQLDKRPPSPTEERKECVELCRKAVYIAEQAQVYRNEHAHNRASYRESEAETVFGLTKDFMGLMYNKIADGFTDRLPRT